MNISCCGELTEFHIYYGVSIVKMMVSLCTLYQVLLAYFPIVTIFHAPPPSLLSKLHYGIYSNNERLIYFCCNSRKIYV